MVQMSRKVQLAAVLAALDEGKSLESIERDHPELAEGVKAQREARPSRTAKRGSGPDRPLPSPYVPFVQ